MKILLSLLFAFSLQAKEIKVAVIDTGKSFHKNVNLCGSIDLTGDSLDHTDKLGHGSNVSYLISKHAENTPHCQLPIKYFYSKKGKDVLELSNLAIELAIAYKVDVINYSGGGTYFSKRECKSIKRALDAGIKVVAAAGNEGKDLKEEPYYPAMCDNRVIVVGCTDLKASNKGKRINLKVKCSNKGKPKQSGTSQATAIVTGKLIKAMYKQGRKNESKSSK